MKIGTMGMKWNEMCAPASAPWIPKSMKIQMNGHENPFNIHKIPNKLKNAMSTIHCVKCLNELRIQRISGTRNKTTTTTTKITPVSFHCIGNKTEEKNKQTINTTGISTKHSAEVFVYFVIMTLLPRLLPLALIVVVIPQTIASAPNIIPIWW